MRAMPITRSVFFDGNNRFLFEIGRLEDSMLIVEKYNFLHAGLFPV